MLRALVALLLLANAVFWAWSQGWLDNVVSVRSTGEREPQRLAQQLRPEIVRVLPAQPADPMPPAQAPIATSAAPLSAPATTAPSEATPAPAARGSDATPDASAASSSTANSAAPTVCLEAGPYTDSELAAAQAALAPLALGDEALRKVSGTAATAWIIYMGRYTNPEQLAEKQSQISRIRGVKYERVRGIPELDPGFSLGRYPTRAEAQAALADLNQRGIRTARVVAITPPGTVHRLRVEASDPQTAVALTALQGAALGSGFRRCEPLNGTATSDQAAASAPR